MEEKGIKPDHLPFCAQDYETILAYITYISADALVEIYKHIDKNLFQKKYSKFLDYSYYRSLCQFCKTAQGDNFVINEFNAPFVPTDFLRTQKIERNKILCNIKLIAGVHHVGYDRGTQNVMLMNYFK